MSGHSKWANIKRQKEANDKVKGSVFAKLSRLITLAIVEGNGVADPEYNVRLRLAIDKAKEANMPKENISRAVEKGSGPDSSQIKEVRYEAFGPGGTALLIIASTDNNNRTNAEIRNILERHGGKMGGMGAVHYMFSHVAAAIFNKSQNSEEALFEFASTHNASDFYEDDHEFVAFFPYEDLGKIKHYTTALALQSVEEEYKATTTVPVDTATGDKLSELIGALEELDDVHNVYTNASIA